MSDDIQMYIYICVCVSNGWVIYILEISENIPIIFSNLLRISYIYIYICKFHWEYIYIHCTQIKLHGTDHSLWTLHSFCYHYFVRDDI